MLKHEDVAGAIPTGWQDGSRDGIFMNVQSYDCVRLIHEPAPPYVDRSAVGGQPTTILRRWPARPFYLEGCHRFTLAKSSERISWCHSASLRTSWLLISVFLLRASRKSCASVEALPQT